MGDISKGMANNSIPPKKYTKTKKREKKREKIF
jgi:hypothetical protein